MTIFLYALALLWSIAALAAGVMVIWCSITRCRACGGWCEGSQDCDQIRKERGL